MQSKQWQAKLELLKLCLSMWPLEVFVSVYNFSTGEEILKPLEGITKSWGVLWFLEFIVRTDFYDSLPNLALKLKLFSNYCRSATSNERNFLEIK